LKFAAETLALGVISEKQWRADSVARLFLCILTTLSFGLCLDAGLQSDKIGLTEDQRNLEQLAVMTLFFDVGSLAWIWHFLREIPMPWSEAFGLESFRRRKAVLWGLGGALLFLPAAWGLQGLLGYLIELATRHPPAQQELVLQLQKAGMPWREQVLVGVLAVLIVPVAEETLFRGILYPSIKQNGFPRTALWVTSLLFAALHFNLLSFVPLTVFSLLLIFLYEKTGSLWASITAHSLFNFANFLFATLATRAGHTMPVR
jgi:membrane protease YdiL (CAAX protease family)